MATWHDLPQELLVSILQYIFAGKRVTFRRRPRVNDPHATKLLSILTVSETFIGRNVVLGAMLESVDVVLYSVTDLYKLGALLGSHEKRALRSVAVKTDCLQVPSPPVVNVVPYRTRTRCFQPGGGVSAWIHEHAGSKHIDSEEVEVASSAFGSPPQIPPLGSHVYQAQRMAEVPARK